jgi:hypothetical protein
MKLSTLKFSRPDPFVVLSSLTFLVCLGGVVRDIKVRSLVDTLKKAFEEEVDPHEELEDCHLAEETEDADTIERWLITRQLENIPAGEQLNSEIGHFYLFGD